MRACPQIYARMCMLVHVYIYICMRVCVCACACVRTRGGKRGHGGDERARGLGGGQRPELRELARVERGVQLGERDDRCGRLLREGIQKTYG